MLNKVTQTILEQNVKVVKIGLFSFRIKPTTLAQVYELGAIVEQMEQLDLTGNINIVLETLKRYTDLMAMQDIALTLLFRSRRKRAFWRPYVRKCLTMDIYKEILETGMASFKAAFFLTSITFLKGVKETTKLTNTAEATVHGDSSEE